MREGVQDVLGMAGRQVLGYVVDVVRVHTWLAACDCDARFGSRAGKVWREVDVEEFGAKRAVVRDFGSL